MEGELRNYITSDEYFMTIAKLAGMRSKETLQIGTCIVDSENRILSIGYNGMPDAYRETDPEFPAENAGSDFSNTIHRETSTEADSAGIRLYTSMFPSRELVREIIRRKVGTVIYDGDSSDSLSAVVSARLLNSAGITCRRYRRTGKMIAFAV